MRHHLLKLVCLVAFSTFVATGCPMRYEGEPPETPKSSVSQPAKAVKPGAKSSTTPAESGKQESGGGTDQPGADKTPAQSQPDEPPGGAEPKAIPIGSDPDGSTNTDYHKPANKPDSEQSPLFVGWPKPQAVIVLSGEQLGYLEPCGCAGLENQKGGLSRRHTLVKSLREKGWPVVLADAGGQIKQFGRQAEIKFHRASESLAEIGYQAVGFGPQELRLPVEFLLLVAEEIPAEKRPFVSANVGLFAFDTEHVRRSRVVEAGGRKIGITSVLSDDFQRQINNPDLVFADAAESLAAEVPKLRQSADFLILLAHAKPEDSIALAKQFPDFDLVVTAGGAAEPPADTLPIEGIDTRLVEVGHKGMYVAVIGLFDDPEKPIRYQRVPLDARFADSPEMKQMLTSYQKELQALGLAGLELEPRPHPSGKKFAGSQACADCHTKAYEVWENTPHAHATQTLVDLTPQRHFDPECLSCHTTGWDPQKFYPYVSGYLDLTKTAHLRANGCENCHGPGAEHAAVENGELEVSEAEQGQLRLAMRLTLKQAEAKCITCHDLDNSPEFKFDTYWEDVAHKGKD